MDTLEIPAKVFLIGEYAVIRGGFAVLAPLRPSYSYSVTSISEAHPDSPYGKYLNEFKPRNVVGPAGSSKGFGSGFGSSTAELIAGVFADRRDGLGSFSLLGWYQENYPQASGADLAVQLSAFSTGTTQKIYGFSDRNEISQIAPHSEVLQRILLFKSPSDQKLPTHEDLALGRVLPDPSSLDAICRKFLRALHEGLDEQFETLNEYADAISSLGLERPFGKEVRLDFRRIPGVIAVKGCGAGLNDAFLVVVKSSTDQTLKERLMSLARSHRLEYLGDLSRLIW